MSRIHEALAGGGKLITFLVAGDPSTEESLRYADMMIESGTDVLEVGLPFSDPIADGPTIQAAAARALESGMNTDKYFEVTKAISEKHGIPLVCLTYYNLVLQYGLGRFAEKCAMTGVDGVIIPDLPIEEAEPLMKSLEENSVDLVFLVADTTTPERLERILEASNGFIYIVARLGTTGERKELSDNLKSLIERVREKTEVPVAAGFGISNPGQAKKVIEYGADAAIIGSAIVKRIGDGDPDGVRKLVSGLSKAVQKG